MMDQHAPAFPPSGAPAAPTVNQQQQGFNGMVPQPNMQQTQQSMQPGMQQPGMMQPGMNTMGYNNNTNTNMMQGNMGFNNPTMMGQPQPQNPNLMMNTGMMNSGMSSGMMNSGMMPPNQQQQQQQQPGMVNSGMMHPQQPQPGMMNPNQQPFNNMQPNINGSMMNGNNNGPTVMDRNPPSSPSQPQPPSQPTNNGNYSNQSHGVGATSGNGNGNSMLGSSNRLARPAFIDPTTNIMYETDQAEYEGWLTKQSMWLKDWRRRYVILKGNKLFFAKNEYQAPHGMIDLAHCTTVKSADWKSKKRHSFEISTPEITYLLYADTESEKDDWIGRVGKAIVRCSRTYVGRGGAAARGGGGAPGYPGGGMHQQLGDSDEDEDDDIYTNDDPQNPYYND